MRERPRGVPRIDIPSDPGKYPRDQGEGIVAAVVEPVEALVERALGDPPALVRRHPVAACPTDVVAATLKPGGRQEHGQRFVWHAQRIGLGEQPRKHQLDQLDRILVVAHEDGKHPRKRFGRSRSQGGICLCGAA